MNDQDGLQPRQLTPRASEVHGVTPNEGLADTPQVDGVSDSTAGPISITPIFQLPGFAFKPKKSDEVEFEPPPGFQIVEVIGKGGMGVVYRAIENTFGRDVALKVLHDKNADSQMSLRFLEEARITGQLQHPGIPAAYRVGFLSNQQPFLAMKLIRGKALNELLADEGPSSNRWLAIFEGICQAVGYAHSKGVVHRDLKPHNVMVGAFGEVQVMDWGLAKVLSSEVLTADLPADSAQGNAAKLDGKIKAVPIYEETLVGSVVGTPAYMSPEQALGEVQRINAASDVFGLGAILASLLTGKPPYIAANVDELLEQAKRCELQDCFKRLDACQADADIVALCRRCLSPNPQDRPANGSEVAQALEQIRLATEARIRQAEADRERAKIETREAKRRRRNWLIAGGLLCLILAIGLAGTAAGWIEAQRQTEIAEVAAKREGERATSEELAKLQAQESARAERVANDLTQRRLKQIQASNQLVFDIFRDLNIRKVEANSEPIEAILAQRLVTAGQRVDEDLVGDPETTANLLHQLGTSLLSLGFPVEAIPLLERARTVRAPILGESHRETIASELNLAEALDDSGQHRRALEIKLPVVEKLEGQFGVEHPDTLMARANLASSYSHLGENATALPLFMDVLDTRRRILGNQHFDTLTSINNLSFCYMDLGRYEDAFQLLDDAMPIFEQTLGPTHHDTLLAAGNYVRCLERLGQVDKALQVAETKATLAQSALGRTHRVALILTRSLASLYWKTGQKRRAMDLLDQVKTWTDERFGPEHLEAWKTLETKLEFVVSARNVGNHLSLAQQLVAMTVERFGERHPDTIQRKRILADILSLSEQMEAAIPIYESVLAYYQETNGADHPLALMTMNDLAMAYLATDRVVEAVQMSQTALDLKRVRYGDRHRETLVAITNQAVLYRQVGRVDLAIPLYEEALAVTLEEAGPSSEVALGAKYNLATAYFHIQEYDKARDMFERFRTHWREAPEPNMLLFANLQLVFARRFFMADQYGVPEPWLAECVEQFEEHEPEGWRLAAAHTMLGRAMFENGEQETAESLLLSGHQALLDVKTQLSPDDRSLLTDSIRWLIHFYKTTNNPTAQAQWQEKLETFEK